MVTIRLRILVIRAAGNVGGGGEPSVLLDCRSGRRSHQEVAGREAPNIGVKGGLAVLMRKHEEVGYPCLVKLFGDGGKAAEHVQLRGDGYPVRSVVKKKRFSAKRVTRGEETARCWVPDDKRKRALEMIYEGRSPLCVRREHEFYV
jgi:hypothetical protein